MIWVFSLFQNMVLEVKILWIWILKLVNDFNNYENKLIKALYMHTVIICNSTLCLTGIRIYNLIIIFLTGILHCCGKNLQLWKKSTSTVRLFKHNSADCSFKTCVCQSVIRNSWPFVNRLTSSDLFLLLRVHM